MDRFHSFKRKIALFLIVGAACWALAVSAGAQNPAQKTKAQSDRTGLTTESTNGENICWRSGVAVSSCCATDSPLQPASPDCPLR